MPHFTGARRLYRSQHPTDICALKCPTPPPLANTTYLFRIRTPTPAQCRSIAQCRFCSINHAASKMHGRSPQPGSHNTNTSRYNLQIEPQNPNSQLHTAGIIQPYRNIGGKFDMGWPHFGQVKMKLCEPKTQHPKINLACRYSTPGSAAVLAGKLCSCKQPKFLLLLLLMLLLHVKRRCCFCHF